MNLIVSLSDSTTGSICLFISVSTEQHMEKVWVVNPKTDGTEWEYHYFPLPTEGLGSSFSSLRLHKVSHAFQRQHRARKPTRNKGILMSNSCPHCQTLLQITCLCHRSQKSVLYQLIPCYPFILSRWTHTEIIQELCFSKAQLCFQDVGDVSLFVCFLGGIDLVEKKLLLKPLHLI